MPPRISRRIFDSAWRTDETIAWVTTANTSGPATKDTTKAMSKSDIIIPKP